ncbi:UNVERIFIED_CONTAM: hypothetical protein H355_011032 [Colinus virginianus]|nr:hypothetical protein H355_011032 [Colinus virginianus]
MGGLKGIVLHCVVLGLIEAQLIWWTSPRAISWLPSGTVAHVVWATKTHCVLFDRKLLLHLPCPVDSKKGRARFLSEEELLEVTLRMTREFDFINFA